MIDQQSRIVITCLGVAIFLLEFLAIFRERSHKLVQLKRQLIREFIYFFCRQTMTKLHASLPTSVFYVNAGNCVEILRVQIYLVFVSCDSTVNIVTLTQINTSPCLVLTLLKLTHI
jgi:hypothetical protein